MSIPKTSKLTLKHIVENLDQIPNNEFGEKPKPLSPEQKRRLKDMASMFENFGECLKNEEALMNSAHGLTELCELAETYAISECGDIFQKNIVEKDMKDLKKRVMEFQKVTKEAYARMQQLGVAYQDIGHVLGRYYDLKSTGNINPAGENPQKTIHNEDNVGEDVDRVCAWCKKSMGTKPGSETGTTHGICDKCAAEYTKDLPPEKTPSPTNP